MTNKKSLFQNVIDILTTKKIMSSDEISKELGYNPLRVCQVLEKCIKIGMIIKHENPKSNKKYAGHDFELNIN